MGVYIPNETKPSDCYECFCYETEFNMCSLSGKRIDNVRIRLDDCPLIEIPTPHGRLIDENDVKAKCVNEVFDKMGTVAITETYFGDEWADDICDIPTIIEAED